MAPAGSGPGAGAGVGAGRKSAAVETGSAQALLPDWAGTEGRRGEDGPGPALCRTGQSGIDGGAKTLGMDQDPAADITYIRTQQGFLYLAQLTDKWSRKIVGFHLGETLETGDSLKALSMALRSLKGAERPIHHSDRGCQYASHAYVQRVEGAGLKMSMTEKNHSAENALAERVNGILKQEYWLDANFENQLEARQATSGGIHLYNHRRPHTALGMATPQEVHSGTWKH